MASFMSILNQIGTVNGSKSSSPAPKPQPVAPKTETPTTVGVKRKAETELHRPGDKASKVGGGVVRDIKPLPQRPATASAASNPPKPYTGTANGSLPSTIKSKAVPSNGRVAPPNPKPTASMARPVNTNNPSRPLSSGASKPAPSKPASSAQSTTLQTDFKKLSYKEKMARAAEIQKAKAGGQIVHKPTTSVRAQYKSGKLQNVAKAEAESKAGTKLRTNGKARGARDVKATKGTTKEQYQGTGKPKPARPKLEYQGTARPSVNAQPSYRGTAKLKGPATNRAPARPARKYEPNEYLATDDEEEGTECSYGQDEGDGYDEVSDDFSDMEAGLDDISDEEREAERIAKLDDAKEAAQLEKLARLKAERKKALRG